MEENNIFTKILCLKKDDKTNENEVVSALGKMGYDLRFYEHAPFDFICINYLGRIGLAGCINSVDIGKANRSYTTSVKRFMEYAENLINVFGCDRYWMDGEGNITSESPAILEVFGNDTKDKEIAEKRCLLAEMVTEQCRQGNIPNPRLFIENPSSIKGGFSWYKSKKGFDYWASLVPVIKQLGSKKTVSKEGNTEKDLSFYMYCVENGKPVNKDNLIVIRKGQESLFKFLMESSIGTSLPPIVLRGDWIPDYITEELGVEKSRLAVVVNRKDAFADILRKKNLE